MISKKRILFFSTISIFTAILLYIAFSINFIGKYRILVFHNSENITSKCEIYATNVILQEKPLTKLHKSFQTNKLGLYTKMNLKVYTSVYKDDTLDIVFKNKYRGKISKSQHEIISKDTNGISIPINKIRSSFYDYTKSTIFSPLSIFASRITLLIIIIVFSLKLIWNWKTNSN